eukprot:931372-Amphidinium_carterae.2
MHCCHSSMPYPGRGPTERLHGRQSMLERTAIVQDMPCTTQCTNCKTKPASNRESATILRTRTTGLSIAFSIQ